MCLLMYVSNIYMYICMYVCMYVCIEYFLILRMRNNNQELSL